ncbi:peroxisome biogenesis protein 12-like [Trifolium medium]|uniref:Peroxisome biogenesis protein 12-like n=1 Tax=Trifolium medium TaxID=97028 RepID=A0A392PIH1_9FABA|nr:peroxisome biogenesis protein 12-like [Trifolium medium]
MDASSRISKIRSRERERLRGPQWIKTLQGALLSCTYTVLDYAQTGLIAAVFFFKCPIWYQLFLPIESWFAKALNSIALVV